jgi:succinate-semialdehyde dehydrogenase / glutarate-semialdehyde dehydrogenase
MTPSLRQTAASAPPHHARLPSERVRELLAQVCVQGTREEIEVVAPFSGAPLARLPRCTAEDVRAAAAAARRAQAAWAHTGHSQRRRIFLRFHDRLLARQREGLDLVQLESGKARLHALEEVLDVAVVTRHYALRAGRYLRPRRRRGALPLLTRTREHHHPVGLVGCIVPWNYPLNLGITDAIAALLAGNAVLLKPDHQTSLTALWAVSLLREAGLPPELLPVLTGEGPLLGPSILGEVDFVMFTGSTATGRIIARQAADRLIGHSLELGGKNAMIVLPDAELDAAVEGAVRGCFVGAGQVCVSMERVYVHESLHAEFTRRFVARVKAMWLGADLDFGPEMGSLASARQLDTVREHVADAVAKGATVLCGGRTRPDLGPFFFEPTVLTGVTPDMLAFARETFGPVVSLYRYDSVEEAVRLTNGTAYGLSASVWGRNTRRATVVARRLRAGSVNVNEAYAAAWGSSDSPIGGMGESGLGRRHGEAGLLKYTESQTISVQRLHPIAPPRGWSGARGARAMTLLLRLMRHVPGLR